MLLCLFLSGIAQGIGLASLLPTISMALGDAGGEQSSSVTKVTEWLGYFGIEATIATLVAFVVSTVILKNVLTLTAMTYVGYTVADITTNIRRDLVNALLVVRWGYFTTQPIGRITNALSGEATRAGTAYLAAANMMVYTIQAVVYTVVAIFISWEAALIALAVGATVAMSLGFMIRSARRAGMKQTKHARNFISYLSDTLNNIKPLKAMARQADFERLMSGNIAKLRSALRKQVVAKESLKASNETLAAIVLGVGITLAIVYWGFPPAELAVMGLVLTQLVKTFNKMQNEYQKAAISESAYFTLLDQIAEADSEKEPDPSTEAPSFERECSFVDVHFAHPRSPVLQGLTLEFKKNATTVLTGPSGSGKTTITDILLGFYAPDSGQVLIDGRPLQDFSLRQWRSMVGYVPQEPILFHDTIYSNIALGNAEISEEDALRALSLAGAREFVDTMPLGIHTEVGEKGAMISGGQRQRIALARALVCKPSILILDEVTSALDPSSEKEIVENISTLGGQVTVIAITHRPAFVDIADRVYQLAGGKVASIVGGSAPFVASAE
ncbi:ABC transporter ATP-binding protein [Tateyamaria pelophila]|uniref:ABC transporter ATP-binding protein n=1 Tax=Tateyamaria pelophila TaxID=328415 RepID=UPI001CBD3D73|nr:ATP-binding cassette domain-containing protein [Tateyamaria pelophila]